MQGRLHRSFSWFTALAFVSALAAPTVDRFLREDVVRSTLHENRRPAPVPTLPTGLTDVAAYPRRLEDHFDDHLGLRDQLLRWRNYGMLFALQSPTSRGFVPGEDGWIFFLGEDVLPDHRGLRRIGDAERTLWIEVLRERARWVRSYGARYVHVVAPDKESIYPERMQHAFDAFGPTRHDQIVQLLREVPEVELVDLRPALIAAKSDDGLLGPVYHPRGTHWTARGAWIAAREIARVLQRDFPSVPIPRQEDHVLAPLPGHARDDAGDRHYMRGLFDDESQDYLPRVRRVPELSMSHSNERDRITTLEDPTLPRVLLYHDSFGPSLQPHLSEICSRLRCVWARALSELDVSEERPDFVVVCHVERTLVVVPGHDVLRPTLLSSEEFTRLDHVAYVLDPERPDFTAEPGLVVRPLDPPGSPGIELRPGIGSACVILPRLAPPERSRTAVRIRIECPRAGLLGIFYTTRSSQAYSRRQSRTLALVAGPNDVCLEVPDADFDGGLKFRPPESDAPSILRGIEVRWTAR